jgi:hypothetical protein
LLHKAFDEMAANETTCSANHHFWCLNIHSATPAAQRMRAS